MRFRKIRVFLARIFAIHSSTDQEGTVNAIRASVEVRGYNGWLLVASSMLASIGLDTNSDAVIIGAMLVSPLMSPILGLGLSFGINDRGLLFKSLKNFGIAVGASLAVSIAYFIVTPLGDATPAILARTTPTTLDVLVAFFGGVAGIVAGSRRDKTTAIPGVAIATALMPPLCVAGYGLATLQFSYFLGAFYLFFINSVFISLATFLIVRYLHFPFVTYPDDITRKKAIRFMSILTVAVVIPSFVVMVVVIRELRFNKRVQTYVYQEFNARGARVIDYEVFREDTANRVHVYLTGVYQNQSRLDSIQQAALNYNLRKIQLKVVQDLPPVDGNDLSNQTRLAILKELQPWLNTRQARAPVSGTAGYLLSQDSLGLAALNRESQVIFPDLESFIIADRASKIAAGAAADSLRLVIPYWKKGVKNIPTQNQQLGRWLQSRMVWDTVVVLGLP